MNAPPAAAETAELLDFAVDVAREAGALTLRYYGGIVDYDDDVMP